MYADDHDCELDSLIDDGCPCDPNEDFETEYGPHDEACADDQYDYDYPEYDDGRYDDDPNPYG